MGLLSEVGGRDVEIAEAFPTIKHLNLLTVAVLTLPKIATVGPLQQSVKLIRIIDLLGVVLSGGISNVVVLVLREVLLVAYLAIFG